MWHSLPLPLLLRVEEGGQGSGGEGSVFSLYLSIRWLGKGTDTDSFIRNRKAKVNTI